MRRKIRSLAGIFGRTIAVWSSMRTTRHVWPKELKPYFEMAHCVSVWRQQPGSAHREISVSRNLGPNLRSLSAGIRRNRGEALADLIRGSAVQRSHVALD